MNIFEFVSFDFMDWITQPYGIFITAGIVLLLIAIILLLTDKKGDKPKDNESVIENTNVSSTNVLETGVANSIDTSAVSETVQPVQNVAPMQVEVPSVPVMPVQPSAQVEPAVVTTPVQPVVESVAQTPSPVVAEPAIPVTNTVTAEPVEQISSVNIPNPSVVFDQQPVSINSVVQNAPEVVVPDNNPQVEMSQPVGATPSVSIYGGVSPASDIYKINSTEKHEIYGGANPLENTATIPNVQNSIYNGTVSTNDVLQNTQVPVSSIVDVPTATAIPSVTQMPVEQAAAPDVNTVPIQESVVASSIPTVEATPSINTVSSSDIEEL